MKHKNRSKIFVLCHNGSNIYEYIKTNKREQNNQETLSRKLFLNQKNSSNIINYSVNKKIFWLPCQLRSNSLLKICSIDWTVGRSNSNSQEVIIPYAV